MRLDELTFQLGIDFTNTVSWRTSANPGEWLQTATGVLSWLHEHGLLRDSERASMEKQVSGGLGEEWRAEAVRLREAGHDLLLRQGDLDAHLEVINRSLATSAPELAWEDGQLAMVWNGPSTPEQALWPIAYSFTKLLTSDMRDRVRECLGDGCGWLFLDVSKNRSRKWCDMSDCGNREKARRHYAKISTGRQKRPPVS